MTITVKAKRMSIEVPAPRRGRPGYRWTNGYLVIDPSTGNEIHPPVLRRELYATARQVARTDNVKVVIE